MIIFHLKKNKSKLIIKLPCSPFLTKFKISFRLFQELHPMNCNRNRIIPQRRHTVLLQLPTSLITPIKWPLIFFFYYQQQLPSNKANHLPFHLQSRCLPTRCCSVTKIGSTKHNRYVTVSLNGLLFPSSTPPLLTIQSYPRNVLRMDQFHSLLEEIIALRSQ